MVRRVLLGKLIGSGDGRGRARESAREGKRHPPRDTRRETHQIRQELILREFRQGLTRGGARARHGWCYRAATRRPACFLIVPGRGGARGTGAARRETVMRDARRARGSSRGVIVRGIGRSAARVGSARGRVAAVKYRRRDVSFLKITGSVITRETKLMRDVVIDKTPVDPGRINETIFLESRLRPCDSVDDPPRRAFPHVAA